MVTMTPPGDQVRQGQCNNNTINPPGEQSNTFYQMILHQDVHSADKWHNANNSEHRNECAIIQYRLALSLVS